MKLLNARINWHKGFANKASLEIMVDEVPSMNDMIFHKHSSEGLYYAELGGLVQFFAYSEPGQGYGGHKFEIKVFNEKAGKVELETLEGPWSSRAGCLNGHGLGPCVDVSIGTLEANEDCTPDRWCAYLSGSITKELAQEAVDRFLPRITMWEEIEGDYPSDRVWRFREHPEVTS